MDKNVGWQETTCALPGCPYGLPPGHWLSQHPVWPTPEDRGIYPKYLVYKYPKDLEPLGLVTVLATSNTSWILEEVDDFCFVLKPIHDKHARIAMAAYAESVKEEKPQLADDLKEILSDF